MRRLGRDALARAVAPEIAKRIKKGAWKRVSESGVDEFDRIESAPASLACVKCHGIQYFYRLGPNAWNIMIHHASGGLLYGYEVKRPAWVTEDRKRAYRPLLGRKPSVRRQEVLERLLRGWKDKEIAKDLG